jgi:hypothetical protein
LLTGARRERTSTSFFFFFSIQLSAKINKQVYIWKAEGLSHQIAMSGVGHSLGIPSCNRACNLTCRIARGGGGSE